MSGAGHSLTLQAITHRYGAHLAADAVSLAVSSGQFLTLLGPSGSGKTTLLMAIAGFVHPDEGAILLDGRDITGLAPEKRNFGLVFQGYALFPHMSVAENIAFPLRVRRVGRAEREARVRAALDLVQLQGFGDRRPVQLSGGQQQRVALARALVFDPALLLLDEPLAALDRQLRGELQEELRALHQRVGRTFIAVTHDQDEALSLSDRVAILRAGKLVQEGAPAELYGAPRTRFVASFLGKSNFLTGTVREKRPGAFICVAEGIKLTQATPPDLPIPTLGSTALMSLRPEKIALLQPGEPADNVVEGTIAAFGFLGAAYDLTVSTVLGDLHVTLPAWRAPVAPAPGLAVRLGWAADAATPLQED